MTSRGLPGFLRRSLRRDDFYTTSEDEDEDEDGDYNSIEDSTNSSGGSSPLEVNNNTTTTTNNNNKELNKQPSSSVLDPSPLAETSAREDINAGWTNVSNTINTTDSATAGSTALDANEDNNYDHNSVSTLGESESGQDALPLQSNDATSTSRNYSLTADSERETNYNHNHSSSSNRRSSTTRTYRETQFEKILCTNDNNNNNNNNNHVVKMSELRTIAWNGIPPQYRGMSWKILLGYLPTNAMRRQQTLERKRAEYKDAIRQHYYIDDNSRTIQEQETLRQVLVDVPRTAPDIPLFRNEKIKRALSRLLYIWAMRHPASSYVQGINDLATPLFAVFLADDYDGEDVLDGSVMVVLEEDRLDEVRAFVRLFVRYNTV